MTVLKSLIEPVIGSFLSAQGRKRLAQVDGLIELQELSDPVEILRDRWGVPHLYAKSLHDLFFAQGFVHGQDRFCQMELHRRLAAGCLSEIFGKEYLEIDRRARTIGFARLARAGLEKQSAETRATLEAYAAGVWSRSMSVTPMGQSGQLGSPHYDDQIGLYLEGKYHAMLWTHEQVEEELEAKLVLAKA